MVSYVESLMNKGIAHAPKWFKGNVAYETIMGSMAYGAANDNSDLDLYGFVMPPLQYVFPHTQGYIIGFDEIPNFENTQEHHLKDPSARGGKGQDYDYSMHSIVKYFKLLMDNNPNIIDSLFVPNSCITHSSPASTLLRENRTQFLHKGCYAKFKGYAFSQIHKMKNMKKEGNRKESFEEMGYDVKNAYHIVRLLLECEMILAEGDIQLDRHSEMYKSIRRGDWKEEDVYKWSTSKEQDLDKLYANSHLRYKPDIPVVKGLLIQCLEMHYGDLGRHNFTVPDKAKITLDQIDKMLDTFYGRNSNG